MRQLPQHRANLRRLRGFLTGREGPSGSTTTLEKTTTPAGGRIARVQHQARLNTFLRQQTGQRVRDAARENAEIGVKMREAARGVGSQRRGTGGSATASATATGTATGASTREPSQASRVAGRGGSSAGNAASVPRSGSSSSRGSGGSGVTEGSDELWKGMFSRRRGG